MTRGRQYTAWVAGVIAIGFSVAAGWLLLWTTFMAYDDEGYVLFSLRSFARGGRLYDDIYSQYGPFFFLVYAGLAKLGFVFTNNAARGAALFCWIGTALVCGAIVTRATRGNLFAGLVTFAGVFLHLWPMISEPSHPGGLIALIVGCVAWAGTADRLRAPTRAIVVGIGIGCLALTKINIGVFVAASAVVWWMLQSAIIRVRPKAFWMVAALFAMVPVVLMQNSLEKTWVQIFSLVGASAAAAMTISVDRSIGINPSAARQATYMGLAVLISSAIIIALILISGTSPRAVWEGVVLGPLRHPFMYSSPLRWRPGTLLLAIITIPLAWWAVRYRARPPASLIASLRILVVAGYIACCIGVLPIDLPPYVLSYGILTAWCFILPLSTSSHSTEARNWLGLLLVMQSLHAFPVAGSQISWGTFLWVPLAAIGLHEVGTLLSSTWLKRFTAAVIGFATAVACFSYLKIGYTRFQGSAPLLLPGAEAIRPPERFSNALQTLAHNSKAHADVLFSLPGMQSFNLWTGVSTPTLANATHWFNLLSDEQQEAILERLMATPRSAVIVQRSIYNTLVSQNFVHSTHLLRWVIDNYHPVFSMEGYEFWVRKNHRIAPIDTARVLHADKGSWVRLEIVIAPSSSIQIAKIELRQFRGDGSEPVTTWSARGARFIATPILLDGRPNSPSAELEPPFPISRPTRIDVFTNRFPSNFDVHAGILYLRDENGEVVGKARLIE